MTKNRNRPKPLSPARKSMFLLGWQAMGLVAVFMLLLSGCAWAPMHAAQPAEAAGWQALAFNSGALHSVGWQKPSTATASAQPVQVYIEGDGFAWASVQQPSNDPTPKQPVALQLALLDPAPAVVYLARPCQFAARQTAACDDTRWWTSARFSRTVIQHFHTVLSQLASHHPKQRFALTGYSGGAAIAVILAAERQDVVSLRTVAGNLDSVWINQFHHVSPMPESLNPIDFAPQLSLPQLHVVSAQDRVVPAVVATRFVGALAHPACASVLQLATAGHQQGWTQGWPAVLATPLPSCQASLR